jgi:hypothetical protein
MDRDVIVLERAAIDRMLRLMIRAEGYCRNAVSTSQCDPHDDAICSYPGASGYAGATLREVIQELETAL